ncbi:MAG: hypothetical protein DCC66_01595 [Planctomycetota bacterium]|nr:MAG: hypothetical protein DCC66_01595 [Planctomycetota bacterium]
MATRTRERVDMGELYQLNAGKKNVSNEPIAQAIVRFAADQPPRRTAGWLDPLFMISIVVQSAG